MYYVRRGDSTNYGLHVLLRTVFSVYVNQLNYSVYNQTIIVSIQVKRDGQTDPVADAFVRSIAFGPTRALCAGVIDHVRHSDKWKKKKKSSFLDTLRNQSRGNDNYSIRPPTSARVRQWNYRNSIVVSTIDAILQYNNDDNVINNRSPREPI